MADGLTAIDLFAGAGGFTTGAEMAGVNVVWAANHWPEAVQIHADNHPRTEHLCQDLQQADWTRVPAHDLLLASPACQGHSPARGKERPHHDACRSTAWAVISALECHRPQFALVENVPAFLKWTLYSAWREAAQALGYSVSPHVIDFADLGVPQNRERVVIVLTRSRAPLTLQLPKLAHVPVSEIIDFKAGRWSPIERKGRAVKTLARIANGRRAHGDRFLMPYYANGSGLTGRSLQRPIGTITTIARWAIVDGDRMRMVTVDEARQAMTFPVGYLLPGNSRMAMHMLGNAAPPVGVEQVVRALRKAA